MQMKKGPQYGKNQWKVWLLTTAVWLGIIAGLGAVVFVGKTKVLPQVRILMGKEETEEETEPEETVRESESKETEPKETEPLPEFRLVDSDAADLSGYEKVGVMLAESGSESIVGYAYSTDKVLDGDRATFWMTDGLTGNDGVRNVLRFTLSGRYKIHYITFCLGNWSSESEFGSHHRPKGLNISAGGYDENIIFPDEMKEFTVEISNPAITKYLNVRINSIYEGGGNTCISEIGIYGEKVPDSE